MRKQLPSLPEVPVMAMPPEAPSSELGIEVNLAGGSPTDRASEGILGPATSLSPEEDAEPRVYRSPVIAQTALRRILDAGSDLLEPPWTPKKKIVGGAFGGAALVGLLLMIVAATAGSAKPGDTTTASSTSTPAGALSSIPGTTTARATVPTAAADHANAPDVDHVVPMLHVTANATIAQVALPDRVIDAVVPAPTVGVDLTEADEGKTLKVVVTSTDGRTATATAEPGTRDLEVTFGGKPAARPLAPTHAANKERDKRNWPKRTTK
jgi:hypothetical protein